MEQIIITILSKDHQYVFTPLEKPCATSSTLPRHWTNVDMATITIGNYAHKQNLPINPFNLAFGCLTILSDNSELAILTSYHCWTSAFRINNEHKLAVVAFAYCNYNIPVPQNS